jgi:hypothetical protein
MFARYEKMQHYLDAFVAQASRNDPSATDSSEDQLMDRMRVIMNDAMALEAHAKPLREQLADIAPTDPEIRSVHDSLTRSIESLLVRIDLAEKQARDSLSRLRPELNTTARAAQMKSAYKTFQD